jgi:cell division protein FtsB
MNRPRISGRQVLIGAAVALVFLLLANFNSRLAELQRLTAERDNAAAEATKVMQTAVFLETQIAYATSDTAVEAWAYEDGKYVRPGDVLVVPLEDGGFVPTPTPIALGTPEPVQNWEVWWSLFFPDSE